VHSTFENCFTVAFQKFHFLTDSSVDLGSCVPDDPSICEKQGISENYWKYLMVSAVLTSIVYGLVFIPSASLTVYKCCREVDKKQRGLYTWPVSRPRKYTIKYVEKIALGGHYLETIIIIVSLIVNLAYFALYWRRTYLLSEICLDQYDPEWKVELGFTCYFIVYFCWRLAGGYQRREFWFDITTIVDLITIPHIFVSIAVDHDWLGVRYLRIIWFNHIIDLLRDQSLFKSQRSVNVLALLSYFLTFWLALSGAFHVLEVTGDPWHDFTTRRCDLAYPDCIYFIIVTITTLGYGDISPDTEVGRIFVSLLIIASIILVAHAMPTMLDLFESYSRYSGSYTQVTDAQHVVISGYINAESIRYF